MKYPYWKVEDKIFYHFPKEGIDIPYGETMIWEVDEYEQGESPASSNAVQLTPNVWAVCLEE